MNRLVTNFFLLTVATSLAFARVLRHAEVDHHPRYAYRYEVNDPVTKDIKEHWEARIGDHVKGSYSLVEPDGNLRVVDYWANDAHGFNANVKRLGPNMHMPTSAKVTPVVEVVEDIGSQVSDVDPTGGKLEVLPEHLDSIKPLESPANYGFGSEGGDAPLGLVFTNYNHGSHRWDPKTGSYGGWVPLPSPNKKYATIFSKKYIDGKLHKIAIGPVELHGRTLVFKVKN